MRRNLVSIAAAAILSLAAATAHAQSTAQLRVRLDAGNGAPIAGALVALLEGSRVVAEGLSSASGIITIGSAPGAYRVRVRRIGFRPFLSDPVTLPFKGELVLRVESEKIVLNTMIVSASAHCGEIKRDAQALSTVWDAIAIALRASQLTSSDLSGLGTMRTYKREIGRNGEVVSNRTSAIPITDRRPFGAIDPASLLTLGYVRGNESAGWEYFAPDETVLLSDGFAATHCFKVLRDPRGRAGQIGVAFEPVPNRKQSDIRGVLWVDEKSAELRDVRFVFVNAGILTRFKPGGFAKFRRTMSGTWIVNEWQLSMPKLEVNSRERLEMIGSVENGGYIAADSTSVGRDSIRKQ
ncbi:MAG TPA: carboxypeptidase-like regulatory domain-containing protein [Gemmatimonadaceae bacterium]|nr:carboxypeptidase-like regulatory domain-containing protein [Gemmatimonadaceae bacterium]